MKRLFKKTKGLIKGTSSAMLLSAVIHLILLSIAGGLVIFTVIKKDEKKFVPPPPVERPKMNLIKPKVRMKNPPRSGSARRIVSKTTASMPDMQLPALEGMGEGLSGGIGGFEMAPDLADVTLFGNQRSVAAGSDFEGTFYSFYYDRAGREIDTSPDKIIESMQRFIDLDWNPRVFAPFYRSPRKLYTTHFCIPGFVSGAGPDAFGEGQDPNFLPRSWCLHYKGKFASRTGGRFRFWSAADEILIVRVNKKIVLEDGWADVAGEVTGWKSSSKESLRYELGYGGSVVGDWFELQPEVPVEMEVLFEENGGSGGLGSLMLLIQEEGVNYPKTERGAPILPAFKTAEISPAVRREIEYTLIRTDATLDGPVFNAY